jgi:hypothetical protein
MVQPRNFKMPIRKINKPVNERRIELSVAKTTVAKSGN